MWPIDLHVVELVVAQPADGAGTVAIIGAKARARIVQVIVGVGLIPDLPEMVFEKFEAQLTALLTIQSRVT